MPLLNESKIKKQRGRSSTALLQEQHVLTGRQRKEKRKKVLSWFADLSPVVDVTDFDFFELRSGRFMEIVQVTSKDIYSLNESDKDTDIYLLTYLFQAYSGDLKLVPLYTPVNLEIQKNRMVQHIRRAKDPSYVPFLEKKLAELEFIEKNRMNKEYFFFLYGDSVKELRDYTSLFKKLVARTNPMIELGLEKKINVLYQLANMNSKPRMEE